MRLALEQARISLTEGEFPVGCVLVKGGKVVATGRRYNSEGAGANELDHAEVVTLRNLLQRNPEINCAEITAYSTMEPCLMCYATMLLSGIRRFVWAYEDVMGGGTGLDLSGLPSLYSSMQVVQVPAVLREESLSLFANFFKNYSYWQGSILARYTLEQYNNLHS